MSKKWVLCTCCDGADGWTLDDGSWHDCECCEGYGGYDVEEDEIEPPTGINRDPELTRPDELT